MAKLAQQGRLGDCRRDTRGLDGETNSEWIRLNNYGVMHCFIVEWRADSREALGGGGYECSVLVELGKVKGRRGTFNLWPCRPG